ncbi:hypothetical protein [Amycolatopsis nalaikhensis]|uniref:Restriction endonuclease n=1 Tax=Amycolatopsis nalaikhensis TaxID=715472 RepID=A0ABY8XCQ5_9PSEU|nr:hypothetical protein [Amycolatopsis sp. 2-2]WIV52920.1 hypothetical protein QP939_28700 [Amycolatopsis sp. 2-2]
MTDQQLFSRNYLQTWLEKRQRDAIAEVQRVSADEILARPHEQVAEEIIDRYLVPEPRLDLGAMTGEVGDQQVDISGDPMRVVSNRSRPFHVPGSRIMFKVPYTGPTDVLYMQASTYSFAPPHASVTDGYISVSRDVPADVLERDRNSIIAALKAEITKIDTHLDYGRSDIAAANEQLRAGVARAAQARRAKVLADRDTEAILGVPLHRDQEAVKTYRVQPVSRRQVKPTRQARPHQPFAPEPAVTAEDFAYIIGDIVATTRMFERLAVTYADQREERLRDQILTALHSIYGAATGETFSKRGRTDIYLPWDGGAVFLAECKWWSGPKNFAEHDLPQLLDRYITWRDTHAAMVLFIRNKNATAVIADAENIVRAHHRYLRDAAPLNCTPVFVLHKDGDPDREITLALVTVAIHD